MLGNISQAGSLMNQFKIEPLITRDQIEWEEFIDLNKFSTIFHTLKWKQIIEETFRYKSNYVLVKNRENKIVGISPSFLARTFSGRIVVSQPFFEYGGPLVQEGSEEAYEYLSNFYKKYVDIEGLKYVELRSPLSKELTHLVSAGFTKQFKAYNFYIDIRGKDFENDIWHGLYTKKSRVRNSVSKAINSGVRVKESRDIDTYYKLYINTLERLGSPPYPRTLFESIERRLGPSVRFTYAYLGDLPVAGMMSFLYNKRDLMVGLVSDESYNEYRANDLLYNEQIEYATRNKFDVIDFGRTRPNSFYERYKKKWGASRSDLFSYIYPDSARQNINPYRLYLSLSQITTKIPWIFTRTKLGSLVIKYFP